MSRSVYEQGGAPDTAVVADQHEFSGARGVCSAAYDDGREAGLCQDPSIVRHPGSAPNEGSARVDLPSWFLPRPAPHADPGAIAAFERLFAATVERGAGTVIDYRLLAPKWQ